MATDVKVSLTIEGTDATGKKSSTKIPYINPNISNETMKDFAEKCAALSADTYIGTTKTTEEDITNGGDNLEDGQYSLSVTSDFAVNMKTGGYIDLTSNKLMPQNFFAYTLVTKDGFKTGGAISVSGFKPKGSTITPFDKGVQVVFGDTVTRAGETTQLYQMRIDIAATDKFKPATFYVYLNGDDNSVEAI